MLAQRDRLRAMQSRYPKMTLMHGSELNIDPDGGVDWGPEFLAGFDGPLVASVHSHFNQSRDEMTRRIVTACENPFVNIIGHPTARLIGRRPPIDYDLDAVFEAAARTGTALEINSFPDRLDLRDEHILWARRHGVRSRAGHARPRRSVRRRPRNLCWTRRASSQMPELYPSMNVSCKRLDAVIWIASTKYARSPEVSVLVDSCTTTSRSSIALVIGILVRALRSNSSSVYKQS